MEILNQNIEDSGPVVIFTITTSQPCDMSDLDSLWVEPDWFIRSHLYQKGWMDQNTTVIISFKMDVKSLTNDDGTQTWKFRYYLPPDRQ